MTSQMAEKRSPRLPEHGIITENGHYFHHTFAKTLTDDEKAVLMEHGLDCGFRTRRFTKEEDAIIHENWTTFANLNNIGVEHAKLASKPGSRSKHQDLFGHADFTNFWPSICKGLPNRSAFHIQWRMQYMYERAIVSGEDKLAYNTISRGLMLSDDVLEKVDKYRVKNKFSWAKISEIVERSCKRCIKEHNVWIKSNNQISRKLWMKLWNYVNVPTTNENCDLTNVSPVIQMVKSYCFSGDSEILDTILESLDISSHAEFLDKKEKAIRNTWKTMLESLRSYICEERKKTDALPDEILFLRAVNETIRFVDMVSFKQLTDFLKILIKATPAHQLYSAFTRTLYDIPSIEAKMTQRKITGFYCGNESEFVFLFKTIHQILYRCQKIVFSLFHRHYSVKERLAILLETLELQWTLLHENLDKNSAKQVDFNEYSEKNHVMPRNYIYVRTLYFLDVLVTFTVRKDPKWIPPTKLQNYMIRPETKALFPKKKNISALVEKTRSKRDSE